MNPDLQYRTFDVKANDDGPGFSGYASHFNSVDSFYSVVRPGAFKKTLKERGDKIPVLWQHDADKPIGKHNELKEDKIGLKFDITLSENSTMGRDAMALLRDGVPLGMSFGFQTIKSRMGTADDEFDDSQYKAKPEEVFVIEEVKLWETSLVSFPANEFSTINSIRSMANVDYLTSILNAIRSGELSDELEVAVRQITQALEDRAAAGTPTALELEALNRKRRNDIQLSIALAKSRGWLGVHL